MKSVIRRITSGFATQPFELCVEHENPAFPLRIPMPTVQDAMRYVKRLERSFSTKSSLDIEV